MITARFLKRFQTESREKTGSNELPALFSIMDRCEFRN